jgi:hypothetical protein
MFATKAKTVLERKQRVHFPRRTLITEKENQIVNTKQSMTTQPKLSMLVRTQRKPRSFLMQMKISLSKQSSTKKHQTLNFQSITDL